MIELTSAYINVESKILINPAHIIYVQKCSMKSASYEGTQTYLKYYGGTENQILYCKESYDEIKEMLK